MDKEELKAIDHLKRIFDNLNAHWHSIELLLRHVQNPLLVDDRGLQAAISALNHKIRENIEFAKSLDFQQVFGEIKYIGSRLNNIETKLESIEKNLIKKDVSLEIRLDGYEMVKKPIVYEDQALEKSQDDLIKELLGTLTERESKVLIHRLGLFGEKAKTQKEVGILYNVHYTRIGTVEQKAFRKLRHHSRIEKVKKINHAKLNKKIFG